MNVALRSAGDAVHLISLCTGGGGLDLGIELAMPGARAVCMVEREAFAAAHLVAAMQAGAVAQCPVWSDVTTFDGRPWRGLVDGLIGGIPCQPHSIAGKRLGEDDERDLWGAARRIIVQARPRFVIIENVGGILTSGGAERIYRNFRRLGFAIEIGLFTAAEVGASHERERVFILAVADSDNWNQGRGSGEARHRQPAIRSVNGGCDVANAGGAGLEGRQRFGSSGKIDGIAAPRSVAEFRGAPLAGLFPPLPADESGWRHVIESAPHLEPAFCRVADGMASPLDVARVDRLRMLGNGVVPLEAAYAFRTLATRLAARSAGATWLVRMMGDS